MTTQEFYEQVTDVADVINFCNDNSLYDVIEDIYDNDAKDDYYNECLSDMARSADSWRDLYRQLDDIPDGYDWYRRDEYGEFEGMDGGDVDSLIEDALIAAQEEGIVCDDEPEKEEDEEPEEEEALYEVKDVSAMLGLFADARIASASVRKEVSEPATEYVPIPW